MEEHGFGGQARAERHGAAALPRLRCAQDRLEHEHDGRRGHVAEALEHASRRGHRLRREAEPLLDRVEHRATAGVYNLKISN